MISVYLLLDLRNPYPELALKENHLYLYIILYMGKLVFRCKNSSLICRKIEEVLLR